MNDDLKLFVVSPIADDNGEFLFDQIAFEYDALQWTDDIRLARQNSPLLTRRDAVKLVTKNTLWHWAVGDMPLPDVAETDYCEFAFNAKAVECLSDVLEPDCFINIGHDRFLLIAEINNSVGDGIHVFLNEKGEIMVDHVFKRKYIECGLTGLKFSDPSVPFWKR